VRREAKWALAAAVALATGVVAAEPYARLAAPFYQATASGIGRARHWHVTRVAVERDGELPGMYLRLHGGIAPGPGSTRGAGIITRVQVGAVIEGPLIFWTLVLVWPSVQRQRLTRVAIGLPVFAMLEAGTTVSQLLTGFAAAAAALAGDPDAVSAWDQWSRFLESGGRDVLAVCAALLTIAVASWLVPDAAAQPTS